MTRIAVVGAGGLVGRRVVSLMDSYLPVDVELLLMGHEKSIGKSLEFRNRTLAIEKTQPQRLRQADIVILCTPTSASREIVPEIRGGPIIIDTSNAFRMDPDVPLVVPEVNPEVLESHNGLIAGPNCSTIQLVMALYPLHRRYGIKRVHVATYQSVSGVGYRAVCQTEEESFQRLCLGRVPEGCCGREFPHQIAFNVIPQIDAFLDDGYTKEEEKIALESRKILSLPDLRISATCVRVPVFVGHSEDCMVDLDRPFEVAEVRALFERSPGLVVMDVPEKSIYPMPILAEGRDEVLIGRIRRDTSSPDGLLFWIVADNLRRGAATNAVNIVRRLLRV